MPVKQVEISLPPFPRGFHLITSHIEKAIPDWEGDGLLHVFIKHTSASLTINENADPSVRVDMEQYFNRAVPDGSAYFTHTMEGPDDMTAHIKAAMLGNSLTIPMKGGRLNLGTWQGIYLCEHRNHGGSRKLVLSLIPSA